MRQIVEEDACHDARANQSPATAFLTASPHRPNHQHKAERSELHFLPSDSPPFLLLSPSLSDNGRVMRQL